MARPVTITNDQILDAARQVFLERGYGASTADIAKVAGVSEGTLFKRFETKDALFFAALGLPRHAPWVEHLQDRIGQGDVRTQLRDIGVELVAFFRDLLPRLTMMWSCRMNPQEGWKRHNASSSHPAQTSTRALADYFAAEMRLGRLRNADPHVLVRMFTGAIYHYVSMEMMQLPTPAPMPTETFVHGLIDTLWHGLRPEASA